jgi:hypothetical protein
MLYTAAAYDIAITVPAHSLKPKVTIYFYNNKLLIFLVIVPELF